MFWKKREKQIESKRKEDCEQGNCISVRAVTTLRRTLRHAKSITDGKLYDTEKSTKISEMNGGRLLFVTEKGNYFSCTTECDNYISSGEDGICQVHEIIYSDIRPESIDGAKDSTGRYNPEKYIELFGEVEEA